MRHSSVVVAKVVFEIRRNDTRNTTRRMLLLIHLKKRKCDSVKIAITSSWKLIIRKRTSVKFIVLCA